MGKFFSLVERAVTHNKARMKPRMIAQS